MSGVLALLLFAAAAAVNASAAAGDLASAATTPTAATIAVAVYGVLRMGVYLMFAAFVAVRGPARRPSREPVAFISCALALASVTLLHAPGADAEARQVVAGDAVTVVGSAWMLVSILALGRCFGILPEARGLVTRGPYRLVRHPLYLGELTAALGLVIAQPELWNIMVMAVFVGSQALRMPLEERALGHEFPEYERYVAVTPRILPRPSRGLVRISAASAPAPALPAAAARSRPDSRRPAPEG